MTLEFLSFFTKGYKMEQKIKELGTYCFEHDISLEDLKVIRKELQTKQLRKEFVNNEHIQNFLNLKDKCTITGNLKDSIKYLV